MGVGAALGYRQGQRRDGAPGSGLSNRPRPAPQAPWRHFPGLPPVPSNDNMGIPPRRYPGRVQPGVGLGPAVKLPVPANLPAPDLGRRIGRLLGAIATRANPYLRLLNTASNLLELLELLEQGETLMPARLGERKPLAKVPTPLPGWHQNLNCLRPGQPHFGNSGVGVCSGTGSVARVTKTSWVTNTVRNDYLYLTTQHGVANCLTRTFVLKVNEGVIGGVPFVDYWHSLTEHKHPPYTTNDWRRMVTTAPWVVVAPQPRPGGLPAWAPSVMPELLPQVLPAAFPRAVPWRVAPHVRPNPDRAPEEQPQHGNEQPQPQPEPVPPPAVPAIVVTPGSPTVRHSARPHRRVPPKRGQKERKFNVTGAMGPLIKWALNIATETADVLGALYKAIDEEALRAWKREHGLGGKYAITPQDKARAIYDLIDHIDMGEAIQNLVENELEDALIGGAARRVGRLNSQVGLGGLPSPLVGPTL